MLWEVVRYYLYSIFRNKYTQCYRAGGFWAERGVPVGAGAAMTRPAQAGREEHNYIFAAISLPRMAMPSRMRSGGTVTNDRRKVCVSGVFA